MIGLLISKCIFFFQEAIVIPPYVAFAIRPNPGFWEYVKVSADDLSVEGITITDFLKCKEMICDEKWYVFSDCLLHVISIAPAKFKFHVSKILIYLSNDLTEYFSFNHIPRIFGFVFKNQIQVEQYHREKNFAHYFNEQIASFSCTSHVFDHLYYMCIFPGL